MPATTPAPPPCAARIEGFREDTREARMRIADEAEQRFGRKVAWGARCGDRKAVFTNLSVPVMTRLRMPERRVLDTLVDAGVARSRSDALAWCVRLVRRAPGRVDRPAPRRPRPRREGPRRRPHPGLTPPLDLGTEPQMCGSVPRTWTGDGCGANRSSANHCGRWKFRSVATSSSPTAASADHLDERLRAVGASLWMWLLLRHALQADGPSQRELADLMRIEAPTLVRHLDKLEEQGLVERRRDERDRRIIRVYATPAGSARFEEFHAVVCRADDELRAALGERDAETLSRVLAKVEGYYDADVDADTDADWPVPAVAAGGNGSTTTGPTTTGATTT